jgi:hypothetical protein
MHERQQQRDGAGPGRRRGFLKTLGLAAAATGAAAATPAAAQTAAAQRPAKETEAERVKTRYRETDHVRAYYRTNRY